MATIWRREKGWTARVRRAGHNVSKTFRTRREAEVWAANIERDIEQHRAGIAPRRPFGDALKRYREEVSRKRDGGRWEILRVAKLFGEPTKREPDRAPDPLVQILLSDLGPEHFADWRDRRLSEVSPATVLREWNLLSAI